MISNPLIFKSSHHCQKHDWQSPKNITWTLSPEYTQPVTLSRYYLLINGIYL